MIRLQQYHAQLAPCAGLKGQYAEQRPANKLEWFKNNGWGYRDTKFIMEPDGVVRLTGTRYRFSGQKMLKFKEWVESKVGIDTSINMQAQPEIPVDQPIRNEAFLAEAEGKFAELTFDAGQRILHSHGHSMQEVAIIEDLSIDLRTKTWKTSADSRLRSVLGQPCAGGGARETGVQA